MGDLSAAALFVNRDAGATDSDDVMLRVDYKMACGTFSNAVV
jgi:hypothetical protein